MLGSKARIGGSLSTGFHGRSNGGFTLIELLVVVTIIGMLTSIAVPIFRDYSIRVRLAEAGRVFSPVKTGYTIFYNETGNLPTELADLNIVSSFDTDFSGDWVEWLRVEDNGNVRLRTRDVTELGNARDRLLEFRPIVSDNSSVVNWNIYTESDDTLWVPEKYLPAI